MGFNNKTTQIGEVICYSRGGGWGKETPFDRSERVAVVRGADFPAIEGGCYNNLPIRFEKQAKVDSVKLRCGDIILENSGGTSTRPTGRTLLVTQQLLDAYNCPIIPASFCRLIRFNNTVDNVYGYYWLQGMYKAGRTWNYQNRSTGLSNFQYKAFSTEELIPCLDLEEQRSIANVLSCFDKKIALNNQTNDYLAA